MPLDSLPPDTAASPFLSPFMNGISQHGMHQLRTTCPFIASDLSIKGEMLLHPYSFGNSTSDINTQIIEIVFELVRRAHFPHLPSRFTSFFAVKSYYDFLQWPELLDGDRYPNYKIWEIDAPDTTPCFDSSLLRGGLIFGRENANYYMGFLPIASADYAFNYWSGKTSDKPRMEYLLPHPISANRLCLVDRSLYFD